MLVNLARRIDAVCVAEGIETPEDLEECRRLGIPYGQGFYLGVPSEQPAERAGPRVQRPDPHDPVGPSRGVLGQRLPVDRERRAGGRADREERDSARARRR